MRRDAGGIRLSAHDLMLFTACAHATRLDMAWLEGDEDLIPVEDNEVSVLLQQHGFRHEAAYLSRLEAEGKSVVRIDTEGATFDEAVDATRDALHSGPDVVFQAALEGGMWGGYADFLERVAEPSRLGAFSYEVADTKLKHNPVPSHLLQLVLYSDLVAEVQDRTPERAYIELGTGERAGFRLSQYADYARLARDRLERFVHKPAKTRPVPCSHCEMCRWRERCAAEWRDSDSVFLIAGISRSQVAKLEAADIGTVEALAGNRAAVPGLADATARKLKLQARLQHLRKTGKPHFELRPPVRGKGFDLMPRPDDGDLFYDIESDPFRSEADAVGLAFLHGVWDGEDFTAFWAHDNAGERQALGTLFRRFHAHFQRHPNAHIYHHGTSEVTALRRLATRHGVGETTLDRWFRERRFVDLAAVVRSGLVISEPSYALSDLEAIYDSSDVREANADSSALVQYEIWRETGDEKILAEIGESVRLECRSAEKLRDWLLGIRPERPWLEVGAGETTASLRRQVDNRSLVARLDASDLPKDRKRTLYNLGVYHWRESKPQAWSVFDSTAKDFDDLCDDLECLAGLVATDVPDDGQDTDVRDREFAAGVRRYRYPPQETKLREGRIARFESRGSFESVEIAWLDRDRREVGLKPDSRSGAILPDSLDLLPDFALNALAIPGAIRKVIADQCARRSNRAADDLLARNAPRFRGPSPLPLDRDADTLDGLIAAVRALDRSVLPVQGPPGTGKTYAAVRAILALVGDGKRVAVASNSHEAIRNVLMGCARTLAGGKADAGAVSIVHKISRKVRLPAEVRKAIVCVTSNHDPSIRSGDIVGGTAWLFSRVELHGAFDYLFVDEAGQVSLANLVAMSNAARNLVLIGDPRQLPQVVQGTHPYPANLSCLDWVLGEGRNVEPDRGVFLPETWRMHPDLCDYISSQFYEERLRSHPSTALQAVDAPKLPRSGAWWMAVAHEGRAQVCPEELDAIRAAIRRLLKGTWTDRHGLTRPMRKSDIIVVAPYNAQVNLLADALTGIRVGTVDKFQGQEAPVALVSMTASSADETSVGLDFLLSRERLNVAVSRGQCLSLVFASPRLLHARCATVDQMRLVNALCALPDARAERTGTYSPRVSSDR